ncbi:penicillin acylase family protein [Egicoccus halophilus]|uniref:Peptidase S45 n=1 Tax=Egicoccus halophilus TaxID=1670830 RepID=A0A8J3AAS4_9ACTN|nr:penicillin acylase family protein [Egicoccus halophilus]GGI06618.1 peptidase S45 [Egicoccus halophilus]
MGRVGTWFARGLTALVVLALLVALGVAATTTVLVRRSLPTLDGELAVPGLDARVSVQRDAAGIPTIVARTSDDLFRAQGYVHAQDRFWEMDVRRHITAGRVSELFGDTQLDTDRFVRTLGWRRVAEQELAILAPDTRRMLEAYAEGVNAWIGDQRGSRLSLEHALLPVAGARGYEAEPWTPVDSLAWLKAMAWDLRSNLEDELLRGRLQTVDLGDGRDWQELFPTYPYDRHETILSADDLASAADYDPADGTRDASDDATAGEAADDGEGEVAAALDAALAQAQQALAGAPQLLGDGAEDGIGSNSWVIAPERSATGGALLANDPHLGPAQPSLWYQVGLRCAEVTEDCPWHVAGFSFSGVPGIIIGQNADVAWGFTNLGPDVADLYVEQLDGDRYRTEDGWQDLEVTTEAIAIAGGGSEELTIRATRNGPLFSEVSAAGRDIAQGPQGAAGDQAAVHASGEVAFAVALRWTALEPANTMDGVPAFMRATDFESFRAAAADFLVPSQNLVYADVEGHIGYQAPGRIPVRSTGDGTVPVPGWTGEHTWERYLDFEELPFAFDPPDGQLVTANQAVLPPDEEPFLTVDPDAGYRARRIHELLGERDRLTLDDLLEIQLDNHNGNAEQLVPFLLAVDDVDDEAATAQRVLRDWDLQDDADAAGAAVFNATWAHLLRRTFTDELPDWAAPSGGSRWWEVVRALVDEPDSPWWDDRGTEQVETRDDVLAASLGDATTELVERFGDDPADWRWGAMHTLLLRHGTFGDSGIAPVEALFNRGPLEVAGGTSVVNANGWDASQGYEVTWVPSMRYLVDTNDLDAGRWIHLTGQSGRPFSTHYTDQAELWRDGGMLRLPFSSDAVDAAAEHTLTLTPGDATPPAG